MQLTKPSLTPSNGPVTGAFVFAAWTSLVIGSSGFCIGLWNSAMALSEKGYYLIGLLFGLYAAISLQKAVRDRREGIPVTNIYYNISWAGLAIAITSLSVGLFNANFPSAEKGFYAMSYLLALFASIVVQKNTRDIDAFEKQNGTPFDASKVESDL